MSTNYVYDAIEDSVVEYLEGNENPQMKMTVWLEDEQYKELITMGLVHDGGKAVPVTSEYITLNVWEVIVTIRPDSWQGLEYTH